jgi:hypothetical protein
MERRISVVAQLETAVVTGLKRAERLRQSILKRALRAGYDRHINIDGWVVDGHKIFTPPNLPHFEK